MRTNVSTLLRDFPKVRRAALAGEVVIVETREGNLTITAQRPSGSALLGSLKGRVLHLDTRIVGPTSPGSDWKPSL